MQKYLQNLLSDHLLLKLDFKNAFNCLRHDRMLTVVREKVPELLPLVHSAYSSPSHLFIGNEIIQSLEGVQQGDPLGLLLFCLTIHSIVSQLRSELRIFYMDDGTLGGSLDDVLDDLHTVRNAAEDLGLHLNLTKSEVICVDPHTNTTMLNAAHDLCIVSPDQATLLGSPYSASIDALTVWSQGHAEPPPPAPACCRQKAWDNPRMRATYENLPDTAPDTLDLGFWLLPKRNLELGYMHSQCQHWDFGWMMKLFK